MSESKRVVWVSLLVDWNNVRRALGKNSSDKGIKKRKNAVTALRRLRKLLGSVADRKKGQDIWIETLFFGGFTTKGGGFTQEYKELRESEAEIQWRGVLSRGCRLREFEVVTSLPVGEARSLPGLYRPREKVSSPFLSPASSCCDWRRDTDLWLSSGRKSRQCPRCSAIGRESKVDLYQPQQKMVDALLAAFAFEKGRHYLEELTPEEFGEVWVCSLDADFVPLLLTLRKWGLQTCWLQPGKNTGYGYSKLLARYGVEVLTLDKSNSQGWAVEGR